jgi:hypothetical protein
MAVHVLDGTARGKAGRSTPIAHAPSGLIEVSSMPVSGLAGAHTNAAAHVRPPGAEAQQCSHGETSERTVAQADGPGIARASATSTVRSAANTGLRL